MQQESRQGKHDSTLQQANKLIMNKALLVGKRKKKKPEINEFSFEIKGKLMFNQQSTSLSIGLKNQGYNLWICRHFALESMHLASLR